MPSASSPSQGQRDGGERNSNGYLPSFTDQNRMVSPPKVFPFTVEFFVNALLGVVVGAVIDRVAETATHAFLSWKRSGEKGEEEEDGGAQSGEDKDARAFTLTERVGLFAQGTVQLMVNVLVLYALTMMLPRTLHNRWQNTIPGLAFPALFFGVQVNMMSNIRSIFS